jgi:hypothetical protein
MKDYREKIKKTFSDKFLNGDFSLKEGLNFYSGDKKFRIPIEDCPNIFKKYAISIYNEVVSAKADLDFASNAMHKLKDPVLSFQGYFDAFEKRRSIMKKLSNANRYIHNKFGFNGNLINFNLLDTGFTLDYVLMHDKNKVIENIETFFKE